MSTQNPHPDVLLPLLDLPEPSNIRLSPNGHHITFTTTLHMSHRTGAHPLSTIWLASASTPSSARPLTSGLYNDTLPVWAPDSASIAFISDRAEPGNSSAVYQLPINAAGEAVPLTDVKHKREIKKAEWSPCGKFIGFLAAEENSAEKVRREEEKDDAVVEGEEWEGHVLWRVHVAMKKTEAVVRREGEHVDEFCWGERAEDAGKVVVAVQKSPRMEAPLEEGASIEVVDLVGAGGTSVLTRAKCPMKNVVWCGAEIFFTASAVPGKNNASQVLYSIPASRTNGAESTTKTWVLRAGGKVDCVLGIFTACPGELVIEFAVGLDTELRTIDGSKLIGASEEMTARVVKQADGNMVYAVIKSSIDEPAEVYSKESTVGQYIKQTTLGTSLPERPPRGLTILSVPSADGEVTLDGFIVTPTKETKKAWPTIVFIHGGPYFRSVVAYRQSWSYGWIPFFLSAGYAVLVPNYRGGSGHGDTFAAYARGRIGTIEHDDVITLTQSGIERNLVDASKLIVGGWSQGGFLSYLSAVRNGSHNHGWRFRGAICGAGVTDWDSMAITSDLPAFETELAGVAPWEANKEDTRGRRGSPIWEMGEAAKAGRVPPVLILHGEKDERVPINQAWAFHRGCRKWKVGCEMVTYPREGHAFKERRHWVDMLQRMGRFCDLHLS